MNKKKYQKIAKTLFYASLIKSHLEPTKVKWILASLNKEKMAGKITVLKIYKRFVENQLKKEVVTIEVSQNYQPNKKTEAEILAKTGTNKVNYQINPDLIFGAKVYFDDWVLDNSLTGKLDQLTISNR